MCRHCNTSTRKFQLEAGYKQTLRIWPAIGTDGALDDASSDWNSVSTCRSCEQIESSANRSIIRMAFDFNGSHWPPLTRCTEAAAAAAAAQKEREGENKERKVAGKLMKV